MGCLGSRHSRLLIRQAALGVPSDELVHELVGEPAMRSVLRGGELPAAVGPHSDGGVHSGGTSIPPPSPLHHGAFCLNQRHVRRQKPQLGDLGTQARTLEELLKQRCIGCCDRFAALVVAPQESDLVRVGSEHAGVGLGIPCGPGCNLPIKQLANGVFVGSHAATLSTVCRISHRYVEIVDMV